MRRPRAWPRVQSVQNAYNLLNRTYEVALAEVSMRENVSLLAYSPLGQGYLTGKYLDGARPPGTRTTLFDRGQRYENATAPRRRSASMSRSRKEFGLDPAQMALAFVNSRALRDLHHHRRDLDGAAEDGHRLDRRDDHAGARGAHRRDPRRALQSLPVRQMPSVIPLIGLTPDTGMTLERSRNKPAANRLSLASASLGRCRMPRLFTGIEIPAEIGLALSAFRGGLPGARWIEPENYHITLRFIGDIDERMADDVVRRSRRTAASARRSRSPSTGSTASAAAKPRAVFARASGNGELNELQAEQERLLRQVGLPPETRKFTPHVTLARLSNASPDRCRATTSRRAGHFPKLTFTAHRFVLYSSRASMGGGPYVSRRPIP